MDNEAVGGQGGGIYLAAGNPVIDGCLIDRTVAGYAAATAGGIYSGLVDSTTIVDTIIANCTADTYGGGIYIAGGTVDIIRTHLVANEAVGAAGGMYADGSLNLSVRDSGFIANALTGPVAILGGAVAHASAPGTNPTHLYERCAFISNTSAASGGAIHTLGEPSVVLDTLFVGNHASHAGGAVMIVSDSTHSNNTYALNTSNTNGGAIYVSDDDAVFTNNVFWGNIDDADGNSGGPYTDESAQIYIGGSTPTVSYSIIEGCATSPGFCDDGSNSGTDPDFVYPPGAANGGSWAADDEATYKSAADVTTSTISDAIKTTFTFDPTWPFSGSASDLVGRVFQPNANDHDGDYTLIVAADSTAKTLVVWGDYTTDYVVTNEDFNVLDYRVELCSPAVDAGLNSGHKVPCGVHGDCDDYGMDFCVGGICYLCCTINSDCAAIGLDTCGGGGLCVWLDLDRNGRIIDGDDDGGGTATIDMGAYERTEDDCP